MDWRTKTESAYRTVAPFLFIPAYLLAALAIASALASQWGIAILSSIPAAVILLAGRR